MPLMKSWISIAVLLLLFGCNGNKEEPWLTNEKAAAYFGKIKAACDRDNGKLWGKNLYGPLMFVDRTSRKIIANWPDNEALLKGKDGIYTGTFPKELVINNNPVLFGDLLYAMAPLPAEEDEYRTISRAIHSLFHSFQESEGYISQGYNAMNMDEKNARLWIKLEWNALRRAINNVGPEQKLALRDALIFKGSNKELYGKFASDETRFENYEGLATFTFLLLSTSSPEEFNKRLFENLDRIYSMQSYARSYGSIHGALYATFLFKKGFDFSSVTSADFDLAEKVRELYGIQLPAVCRDVAGSLALNYDVDKIHKEEAERDARIKERIYRQISKFTEKPVVYLELESPYFDFEPEDINPMDTLGTLYSKIRVSDNWGKLSVDNGGCLLSSNLKYLRMTAKGFRADENKFEGEGWHLQLNDGWELVPVEQNYFARRLEP